MLHKPVLFCATANPELSREFYEKMLGLRFITDQPFALVFSCGDITLRIQKVENVTTLPYTAIGFQVDNIEAVLDSLAEKGIRGERYPALEQDERGIWSISGAKIAWIKDPDGNTISLSSD